MDALHATIRELEGAGVTIRGWATPGAAGSVPGAALDLARTVCRRAEREVVDLAETEPEFNEAIIRYLNRLSDLLWLLAREQERKVGGAAQG